MDRSIWHRRVEEASSMTAEGRLSVPLRQRQVVLSCHNLLDRTAVEPVALLVAELVLWKLVLLPCQLACGPMGQQPPSLA